MNCTSLSLNDELDTRFRGYDGSNKRDPVADYFSI